MSIHGHIQGHSLGAEVILFDIDLSIYGQGTIRITASSDNQEAVQFGGLTYSPHPIEAEGFELVADGPLPRPKITIANIDNSLTALVEQNEDLSGAIVRRIITYERFLDSGADPDPSAHKPIDVYQISRKVTDDGDIMAFELSALMDQEGVVLPSRKIVRDYCGHEYRRWVAGQFDYSAATCPYAGASAFDINDDPIAPALDQCSKRLSGCIARFGTNPLPTRAFPGVARLKGR